MLTIKIKDSIHNNVSKTFKHICFMFYCKHVTHKFHSMVTLYFLKSQTSDVQNEAHYFCSTLKLISDYKKVYVLQKII